MKKGLIFATLAVVTICSYLLLNDPFGSHHSDEGSKIEANIVPDANEALLAKQSLSGSEFSSELLPTLEPTDIVKETRSMVAAHASLRVPEVADPDSETNRNVMQQMVLQAFENAKAAPRQ